MPTIAYYILVYLFVWPILTMLVCLAHTEVFIKRKQAKRPRAQQAKLKIPAKIWPKLKERVLFTLKDSRPWAFPKKGQPAPTEGPSHRKVFLGIWGAGLLAIAATAFVHSLLLIPLSLLIYLISLGFSIKTASPIIKERELLYSRMMDIAKSALGVSGDNPHEFISVLEWRDILSPTKVLFRFPTTFNADNTESFLKAFNTPFGTETTWVAFDDPEKNKPGWDFKAGEVIIKEMPPLPTMAKWDEHYVLDPSIAWSFFPIGLGVENGVPLLNPATGEVENVLGFDLSGEQIELSKKLGVKIGNEIAVSPQVLAGGGTGGGKSLSIATKVKVLPPEN